MFKVTSFINKYNKCYVCNEQLNYMFGRTSFSPGENFVSYTFSLITRFHNKFTDSYSCSLNLNIENNSFSVSFFKDKEILNYIPDFLIEAFYKIIINKKFYIFKYCSKCSKYSCQSSKILFNYDNFTFGKVKDCSEFICVPYHEKEVQVHNQYDEKYSLLMFDDKSYSVPALIKTKKYKDYIDKINKYLLLI